MITANGVEGIGEVMAGIRSFAEMTGSDLREEIIRTGRLVAVSVATSTQPYGKTVDVKLQAERRVAADIRKVFASPSGVFGMLDKQGRSGSAGSFWAAWKARDQARMKEIMDSESLGMDILQKPEKSIHQQRRNSRGRVSGGRPSHLVANPSAMAKYITQRQRKVGFAKSGWAAAADACGGHRGIPQWASGRHKGTAPGGARITRDPVRPKVVLYNNVSYINQVADDSMIGQAVDIAYEKLAKRLQIIIRKNSQKVA